MNRPARVAAHSLGTGGATMPTRRKRLEDNAEIPRHVQEGLSILESFYGFDREGDPDRYLQGSAFRDDAYRIVVLHFHLSIEELLKALLYRSISRKRTFSREQNVEFIQRLGFRDTIDWAARLGVMPKRMYLPLKELNDVRNACAHNWTLNSYTMKQATKKRRVRKYTVTFQGKNLLTRKIMKEQFIPIYGAIYLTLWKAYYL
jgi:hypothetical protein